MVIKELRQGESALTILIGGSMEKLKFKASDKKEIFYRYWKSDSYNHQVVLIFHGMAEHSERYDYFAKHLNSLGFDVYAQDHRGHGYTATKEEHGFFADENGWQRVVDDGYELAKLIIKKDKEAKIFLFGHSMGSFLVRTLLTQHDKELTGVVLSGTGSDKGLLGKVGKSLAYFRSRGTNAKRKDQLLDKMSFGSFGNKFKPTRTPFDWLSKDEIEVDKYFSDPLCGFVCTSKFFYDLLSGVQIANNLELAKKIKKKLSVLVISGKDDPVGDFGKGVEKVYSLYKDAGLKDLTLELVEDGRHELLNETNKEEINQMIGKWLVSKSEVAP